MIRYGGAAGCSFLLFLLAAPILKTTEKHRKRKEKTMKRRRTTVDHGMDWATEAIYQMGPCIVKYTQTEETEEDIETELTGARGFVIVHTTEDVFQRVNDNPYDALMGMYFFPYRDEMADVERTTDEELFGQFTHTGICWPTPYGRILEVVADGIRYGLVWDDDPGRLKWGVKMQMRVIGIQARNFARLYTSRRIPSTTSGILLTSLLIITRGRTKESTPSHTRWGMSRRQIWPATT